MRLSGTFLSLALVCISAFARQAVLSSDQFSAIFVPQHDANWILLAFREISVLQLSSLSPSTYTRFSHPAFPGRSARIKKTDFCDGGVKFVIPIFYRIFFKSNKPLLCSTYTGYIDVGARHLFFYSLRAEAIPTRTTCCYGLTEVRFLCCKYWISSAFTDRLTRPRTWRIFHRRFIHGTG